MRWGTPREWLTALLVFTSTGAFLGLLVAFLGNEHTFAYRLEHATVGCWLGMAMLFGPWIVWCVTAGLILRSRPGQSGKWVAVGGVAVFVGWLHPRLVALKFKLGHYPDFLSAKPGAERGACQNFAVATRVRRGSRH